MYLLQQRELLGRALCAVAALAKGQQAVLRARGGAGGVGEQGSVAGHGQGGRDAEGVLPGLHHPGHPPVTVLLMGGGGGRGYM